MAAAPAKSTTAAREAKAERTAARDERVEGRNAGIDTSMADPVDQLQRIAGNRTVSSLVALRNPGSNGGDPLPRHLRGEMETRFGEDFTAVRIHVGGHAAEAASAVRAKAFTVGEHIVFGANRYAPGSFEGRRLLAHELAHVVQQRRGGMPAEARRGSSAELAAEQAARSIVSGIAPVVVSGGAAIGIAREGDEDEIDKALAGSERTKHETDEEVRRKPDRAPKRRPTTSPTTNAPPTSSGNDPALKEHSRETREARQRQKKGQQQDAAIEALKYDNKKLRREIVKLDRSEKKNGALSSEDKDRRDKLKATLGANQKKVGSSEVAAKATRKSRSTSADIERDRLATIAERNRMAGGAPVESEFRDIPEERPRALRRGEKIPGRSEVSGRVKQSLRTKARDRFGQTMQEALQDESKHTPLTQETLKHLTPKQQNYVRRTGKMPAGFEFHHLLTIADYPEFGDLAESGLAIPKDVHRHLGHGGDTTRPLEAATYIDPEALDRPGYTIDAEAKKRHRAKARDIASGRSATPEKSGGVDADIIKERQYELQQLKRRRNPRPGDAARIKQLEADLAQLRKLIAAAQPSKGATGGETPAATPAKGKSPPAKGDAAKTATRRRAAPTASHPPAAAQPGSRARASKPKPAGKAPPAKADAAKTPRRTRAAPTDSAPKTAAPARSAAPARRQRQTKTPTVPPPAPRQTELRPPRSAPRADAGKLASGAAVTASPAAKAAASRQSKPPAQAPAQKHAKATTPAGQGPAPAPPQARRSTEVTRGGGAFLAPGTAGANLKAGVQAKQERGKGVTTSQTLNVEGSVSLDIAEIPDTSPQRYRVTLHVDLGGRVGAGAGRENEGETARAGASLSASGSLSALFSHELSADEARKYRLAAEAGGGGNYQELEIVRLLAARRRDAAAALLQQVKATAGSAEAAKKLAKGDVAQVAAEGTVGGSVNAGAGKSGGSAVGVELGVFRSGRIERRVEERDGKIVVTLTIASEQGRTLGGTGSEGVASFGYANTAAESRLRSVSFSLDPNDTQFDARFNAIARTSSIDDLDRLRGGQPGLVGATTTGKGQSRGDTVNAGVLGVGLEFSQSGSFNEQETRDERGVSHHYEGSSGGGAKLKVGDTAVASTATTDTFVADVGPDNTATGETSTRRSESDLGASIDKLGHSLAKNPVTTVTGVLTGKTKLLQEKVQQSGAALTDDSYAQLASLAENPRAWTQAFNANVNGSFSDWQKTRNKVLAANGDRNQIARAIAEFEAGGGIGRGSTVEKALGKSGIAFEFPDELAAQKQVYDSLIVGDPVGHARDLAERGQQQAALNELNAANDKLGKLADAATAHTGAFESPAKLAEMLSRVADRRAELRAEVRQLGRAAAPQAATPAPKPEIGPPTPEQQAGAEAEQRAKQEELRHRQSDLVGTLSGLRNREKATFTHVREEMDSWHFDHLSASIEMMKALNAVKGSYGSWDETVQKLKASYQELGQDPAQADALAPDRKQWDAVHSDWQRW